MATAYLIAFYDSQRKTIERMQIASEYPVEQMGIGRIHQLLAASTDAPHYGDAEAVLKSMIRRNITLRWTHEYLT
jgi:beta-lactamase superfamily II metal-dependent hydrolase